jgi:hypothetical protein
LARKCTSWWGDWLRPFGPGAENVPQILLHSISQIISHLLAF